MLQIDKYYEYFKADLVVALWNMLYIDVIDPTTDSLTFTETTKE